MSGQLDPWDRSVYETLLGSDRESTVGIAELAELSGLSVAVLQALDRLGFLLPERTEPNRRYSRADAAPLKAGKVLLERGLPLDELLNLAEQMDQAMRPVAAQVVEVFVRFVRDSVEFATESDNEASELLVEAYRTMLDATGELVAGYFRRILLETARAVLEEPASS